MGMDTREKLPVQDNKTVTPATQSENVREPHKNLRGVDKTQQIGARKGTAARRSNWRSMTHGAKY